MNRIRYCRIVFFDPSAKRKFNIDFGYYGWGQRLDSIRDLRKFYGECKFLSSFCIDKPSWTD